MKNDKQSPADKIVGAILDLLKKGVSPWHKPWQGFGNWPANISGRRYRGINAFFLALFANYENPTFLTFNQAHALGGNIRKGEHGWPVLLWKRVPASRGRRKQDADGEEADEAAKQQFHLLLRGYTVFNVEQCEQLPSGKLKLPKTFTHNPIPEAEAVWKGYKDKPALRHTRKSESVYRTRTDTIVVPYPEQFETREAYFDTLFHEAAHSTGHPSRLNRTMKGRFGSQDYAREELIAEIAASLLCNSCGITRHLDNAASYCAHWAAQLDKVPARAIVSAATAAQSAADYILGVKFDEKGE